LRETAAARGLSVSLRPGSADTLPFPDASFDFVLSWNVIYHGTMGDVGHRLGEIWRVLKPGALFQGTMLTTRNSNYGLGRAIAPDTSSSTARRRRATRISIATPPVSSPSSPASSCSR